jgi:hypothetical protein
MINRAAWVATVFFLFAAMVTGASAQSQPAAENPQAKPISPGGVRITSRNPLPGNWICQGTACTCKPLACAASSRVSYSTVPTPARNPNPKALEKFAKVDMPKRILAANAAQAVLTDGKVKVAMLVSKVAVHLGYPSVLNETKIYTEKSAIFMTSAAIFAGPALLTVNSISPDRAVAMQSLNEFLGAMTIEEGPPLPGAQPAPVAPPPGRAPADPQSRV